MYILICIYRLTERDMHLYMYIWGLIVRISSLDENEGVIIIERQIDGKYE